MGVPKFFRYISERYPLTSQLIEENSIPEFDNLYLDFNGIIHTCSHPNDEDAHFRMSEEQIFTSIFAYVDHLFGKIKPKKLFFMAVDGVAPRAKMNQQRSRRFRTAKEAREVREKAERKGEKLPDEKAFDSNCITPGTAFMVKLSEQLSYFVNKKITEDANWREVQVVLSGHEVPGEGEHKIMEYIRLSKAQPDYNPNVRHCLYGLDADLIMLGLLSHDPHFCLLREEVKFGPAAKKRNNPGLESINFYLLHLSLMREYLDLEFREVGQLLPFDYNLERVIDDFIVLAVFIGNDFLPHLPDLHIHENGLEQLFEVYMKVLPSLGGYLNEAGVIDTKRLQVILDEMVEWDKEVFEKEYGDMNWFKGKQSKHIKELQRAKKQNALVLTLSQREIFDKVQKFVLQQREISPGGKGARLEMLNDFPARDREFINTLAADLHLELAWDEYDDDDRNLVTFRLPGSAEESQADVEEVGEADENENEWEDEEEEDEEARNAVDRVLKKYRNAKVLQQASEDFDDRYEQALKEKMDDWKRSYYMGKMGINYDVPEEMGQLAYRYVEGLQWVMHYYYSGVASWSWFYNYHYAPRVSDLKGIGEMTFDFELGKPFRPFEQLMGVMPEASKELLPEAYQDLMWDPNSPIIDFYPQEFEQDMNGKRQEWEAVVKIPFIDEKRLLDAMRSREHRLTPGEKRRNTFGTSYQFKFNPGEPTLYPSSLPGFLPALVQCKCIMEPFDLPTLDGLHLVQGLCDGVFLGPSALAGFPSLKTLPHVSSLGHHGVNVHGSESRNKSIVIHIENPHASRKPEDLAEEMIGSRTFTGWPFLQEATVVALSDSWFKYEKMSLVADAPSKVVSNPHSQKGLGIWKTKAEKIESTYSRKCGVLTGEVDILLHVRPLKGLKRLETGALVKDYEDASKELELALQLAVPQVESEDPRFIERGAPSLTEEFPEGSKVFFLGEHAYGFAARVAATTTESLSFVLAFSPSDKQENEQLKEVVSAKRSDTRYLSIFQVAEMLAMSKRALSRVTSSFMVLAGDDQKINLGLSIKFEGKGMKVLDYSNKPGNVWQFSDRAIDLIRDYKEKYPEVFRILDRGGDDMVKASTVFPSDDDPSAKAKEIRTWLANKGVRDFEPVSLQSEQLDKSVVKEIERLADGFTKERSTSNFKRAMVKNVPRRAVLKPEHAVYRLQNQRFDLGDRVIMVQESGGVPLSAKGVVIGLNTKTVDVVWDVPFISGTTLNNRCSQYRGSTVEFNACLNLTNRQFISSVNPNAQPPPPPPRMGNVQTKMRFPTHPLSSGPGGQGPPPNTWRPRQHTSGSSGYGQSSAPVHIMTNPNRGGRGSAPVNGHGPTSGTSRPNGTTRHPPPTTGADDQDSDSPRGGWDRRQQEYGRPPVAPRGGYFNMSRGRGSGSANRGSRGGGFRGRGRGMAAPLVS